MKKYYLSIAAVCVVLVVMIMSGCKQTDAIAASVSAYCAMAPETRAVNREAVALAIAPNRIVIQCAGDVAEVVQ